MFSSTDRSALSNALVDSARNDPRITGAAVTGSAAVGGGDKWSDVDLAFGVASGTDRAQLIAAWTARMYEEHGAVHHTDIVAGPALFRVFLLANTLQVDLAFWPEADFGAIAPTFRLLFGTANERPRPPVPSFEGLVGMGWLYALHARSSIARGRAWQAEYMISGLRDQVLALACLRHDLPSVQGRGLDKLPADVLSALVPSLVRSLDPPELWRAFRAACDGLLLEVRAIDPNLANRLSAPISELAADGAVGGRL